MMLEEESSESEKEEREGEIDNIGVKMLYIIIKSVYTLSSMMKLSQTRKLVANVLFCGFHHD